MEEDRVTLGFVEGQSSTDRFTFATNSAQVGRGIFVAAEDRDYTPVLGRVYDVYRQGDKTYAKTEIVGRRDREGRFVPPFSPLPIGSAVRLPSRPFLSEMLGTQKVLDGMFLGILRHHGIPVYLSADEIFTRHAAIIGSTGSGKSASAAVLVEELLDKGGTIVIIDPHGEYGGLRYPNTNRLELQRLAQMRLKARSYLEDLIEFSPDARLNPMASQLRFDDVGLTMEDLKMLGTPALKASPHQLSLLSKAVMELTGDAVEPSYTIRDIEQWVAAQKGAAKSAVLAELKYISHLGLFTQPPTVFKDLVRKGKCTIINMRGVSADIQEVVVARLVKRLFKARTQDSVPPFCLLIEECHNFAPQVGTKLSTKPIVDAVAEGRKFQLGVVLISQRPARILKTALSQCGVLFAFQLSAEGDISAASYAMEKHVHSHSDELARLPVGSAVVTGRSFPYPITIDIRPRRTEHTARTKSILEE